MKISGTPIQTPQKQQTVESAGTTGKGSVPESKEQENNAVVLNVSQRNSVSIGGDSSEMDKGAISNLLKSILSNSESTSQLHAGLSPERVLQLLA